MASRNALPITVAMAVVMVGTLLPATASAKHYKVGDDDGWALEVDYDDWVCDKTFNVGDTFGMCEFVYSTAHNLVLVDEESFDACTVPDDAQAITDGDVVVVLNYTGRYFFICSNEDHCDSGMKLTINVT